MQGGTEVASYTYNAQHQRTEKTTTNGKTQFVYQGANLLSELNQNNEAIRDYIWFAGKPVALISYAASGNPASLYAIHFDHLGTSQSITDANQQVVWQEVVWQAQDTPFGEAILTKAEITNPLRFAGQYFDTETQLHYNWNRYYDPALGRYITSDPIGLVGGMNTFGYAGQNPMAYVDSKGLYSDILLITDPSTYYGIVAEDLGYDPYSREGMEAASKYVADIALKQLDVLSLWAGGARLAGAALCGAAKGTARPRELFGRQTRQEFNNKEIKRIKKRIQKNGYDQSKPIDVIEVNGRKIIVDGHHRARAAGAAKVDQVPINILKVDAATAARYEQQAAEAAHALGLSNRW